MASNKGFKFQVKNNAGNYTTLYPHTSKGQVLGWDVGEISDTFVIDLKADSWIGNRQIIELNGVASTDSLYCLSILSGSQEQMEKQREEYNLIKSINSLSNQIEFECTKAPTVDLQVQVWWTK